MRNSSADSRLTVQDVSHGSKNRSNFPAIRDRRTVASDSEHDRRRVGNLGDTHPPRVLNPNTSLPFHNSRFTFHWIPPRSANEGARCCCSGERGRRARTASADASIDSARSPAPIVNRITRFCQAAMTTASCGLRSPAEFHRCVSRAFPRFFCECTRRSAGAGYCEHQRRTLRGGH